MIQRRLYSSLSFYIIRRIHNDHPRNRAHQRKILTALMGCSILADRDTCMSCSNFYVEMWICDRITNLLKSTSCCKHCKGTYKRDLSCRSKSCCNTHHITFCNTTIYMSVRICFLKDCSLGRCCQIGIQYDKIWILLCIFLQRISVAFSCCYFLYVSHVHPPLL